MLKLKTIKKIAQYGRLGARDYDWDFSSIYNVLDLKLNNMYKCLGSDGCLVDWDESADTQKALKALRIAAYLARRLGQDAVSKKVFKRLNTFYLVDVDAETDSEFIALRQRKSVAAWQIIGKIRDRDSRLLFSLISQYIYFWWE